MFRRLLLALLLTATLFATSAHAYEFSPIVAQFDASGPGAARNFTVRNTQPGPVALQIEVFSRTADENGNEVREPDFDNFIVTPPQLVLAPGAGRSVRVQWIGTPAPEREMAFRIVVSQVPINFDEDAGEGEVSATVAIGYTYEVAAYVSPPKASPSVVLSSADPVTAPDGKNTLRLTIASNGTKRAILSETKLTINSEAGGTVVLEGDRLSQLKMKNILSGTQAVVDIPWPEEIPYGPVSVSLDTSYLVMN